MFGWELDTEDARTFNGLILEHLEDIPDEGTVCEIDGLKITILEVSDNMIKQAKSGEVGVINARFSDCTFSWKGIWF